MLTPVVIGGHRITGLLARLDKRMVERVFTPSPRDVKRAVRPPPVRVAAMSGRRVELLKLQLDDEKTLAETSE